MNYIGSISILDRGDAPAQAVIDRNARSLAQRMADETRDELEKVMTRVHTIYGAMDNKDDYPTSANMEYLNDLAELEAILNDEIKKRQYQQQVTVFIVGYQDVCQQKLVLLQQVNEFFLDNSKKIDEEDWFPTTPDLDLDEVTNTVEDSLNHAHELTNRLSELNQEMVEYIATMAEKKASNKGRKKIEKALQQAKDEVNGLNEKLLGLQTELNDKEEKVQSMFKQLESRNLEVQKYRTAAELAKQKISILQKDLDEQKKSSEEIKSDMNKLMDSQIATLHESHRQEMEELRKEHESQAKKMQEELEDARQEVAQAQHELIQLQIQKGVVHGQDTPSEVGRVLDLDSSRQSSKQESRPSTKDTRVSSKSLASGAGSKQSKSPTRLQAKETKSLSRTSAKSGKEYAEASVQDEGGDPNTALVEDKVQTPATRHSRRSKSTLAPVLESDLDNAFDLFDDQSWGAVGSDQISGRFAQYRRLSMHRVQDLEDQLQLITARTQRKVTTLKAQFQEHKSKWEAERRLLMEQVDQSLQLQSDAEKEADAAMTQLEDFISEQERLEQEEELKRSEILQASASLTPADPADSSPHPQTGQTTPDQELQRLMQQTDDAKSLSSMDAGGKMEGTTEEDVRVSSALSRASLREEYKSRLEEAKSAAEDRRSKSPAIQLPTSLTVDDELVDEEEEDDLPTELQGDFGPIKDPSMYEMGTSPPAVSLSRDTTGVSEKRPSRLNGGFKELQDGLGGPFRDPSQPGLLLQKSISENLLDHPLLKEYLKAYECVVNFKEGMGKLFLDKDMMSAHQMTSDLETLVFDPKQKPMPQVVELTKTTEHVLEELINLINNILVYDREPRVSSLNMLSREPTQKSLVAAPINPPVHTGNTSLPEELVGQGGGVTPPATREVTTEPGWGRISSRASEKMKVGELQEQYNQLKTQLEDATQSHQDQLQRNTVLMLEMQDTINGLQRELSTLGKQRKASSQSGSHRKSPETTVMFTRLDSERNSKILKKAVMEEKLEPEKYKEAVSKMDEYVSLPAQRLAHLVKKYVHHARMRAIEAKVKDSRSLDEEVFEVLDKMESLQNQRAHQWAHRMDAMGIERLRLANLLTDTLDSIEQESGIFLIKPMYSYRGREVKMGPKMSRPVKKQQKLPQDSHYHPNPSTHSQRGVSPSHDPNYIPAPTPASNYRLVRHERYGYQPPQQQQQQLRPQSQRPQSQPLQPQPPSTADPRASKDDQVTVSGSGMTFSVGQPNSTWNVAQAWPARDDPTNNSYNTPRILELDINRMLIGHNNISSRVPFPPTEDRLINANHNTLRSYVTVQRPNATFGESASGTAESSQRSSAKRVRVSEVDKEIPASIPSSSPLPPITPVPVAEEEDEEEEGESEGEDEQKKEVEGERPPSIAFSGDDEQEPPRSPPGSSLYQSAQPDEAPSDPDGS